MEQNGGILTDAQCDLRLFDGFGEYPSLLIYWQEVQKYKDLKKKRVLGRFGRIVFKKIC